MTPRSKSKANEFIQSVLNVKAANVEDILEENVIVTDTKQIYQISKFVMVTVKLVGNVIVCDD
jgi:hypothetical protein